MLKIRDLFEREVDLSHKRWQHIVTEHPETESYFEEVGNVLQKPDYVKRSKSDPTVWLYYRFYSKIFSGKYLLVVVKHSHQSFVVTFYITDKIKAGESIWGKK